jgi:predicted TIM-barrel fold metal-dependent hydrolase
MPMPKDIRVIDLHVNVPTSEHNKEGYDQFRALMRDRESLETFRMPAQFLFKTPPSLGTDKRRYVDAIVAEMDKHNIGIALIGITEAFEHFGVVKDRYADRFMFSTPVDPNKGVDEIRRIKRMHRDHGIMAVSYFAAGSFPQVALNDKEMYPIYATCCELEIPILANVGVPGPRIPMATQRVEMID